MRKRDTYWSLFHTPEKRQINDLRTDHVEAIYEAIPSKDHKDWVIWKEGFRTWKPFSDFPQLLIKLREQSPEPAASPAPPSKQESFDSPVRKIDEKIETVSLQFAPDNDHPERDTRYPKVWDLTLIAGDKRYQVKTVDVSLSGMQVAEPLSMSLPRYFTVEIRGAGNTFSVICSAIRAWDMQPTSRLKIEANDQMHAYKAAVLAK